MPRRFARLRLVPPRAARISAVGLVLLWATGLILVWTKWDGLESLPMLFRVKFAFVLALTVFTGPVEATHARIKRTGDVSPRSRPARIGPLSGLSALGAMIFAVFAFHWRHGRYPTAGIAAGLRGRRAIV